ncbi:MAG TPA: hypothetical protein VLH87_03605 [Pyrinomonadaceae bacterium]|nr:hypothetical protein [Pyrinomonadaceae bacterium]
MRTFPPAGARNDPPALGVIKQQPQRYYVTETMTRHLDRREFLKQGLVAATALSTFPSVLDLPFAELDERRSAIGRSRGPRSNQAGNVTSLGLESFRRARLCGAQIK